MKRNLYLLLLLTVISSTYINAQERWHISSSWGIPFTSSSSNHFGQSANLAVGHYVGKVNTLRIDVQGERYFVDGGRDWTTLGVLLSAGSKFSIFGCNRFYSTGSVGLGTLFWKAENTGGNSNSTDLTIPVKCRFEYSITKMLSVGLDLSANLNLHKYKSRSIAHYGLMVGFRF